MNFLFLGTGAADFSPRLAGEDRWNAEDRSIRRSTATLLDERLLLDCGPHTPDAFQIFGADMGKVENILFTHLHSDHYSLESIAKVAAASHRELHIWAREGAELPSIAGVTCHFMRVGECYRIDGYQVTALAANHSYHPLHFSIEKDGCRLFYGLDGAWLLHDTYYAMRNQLYDVMIMDATVGDYDGDFRMGEHNSIPMLRMMKKSFVTWGAMDEKTVFVADHLARTLHPKHEETEEILRQDAIIAAYDGMRLSVSGRERT